MRPPLLLLLVAAAACAPFDEVGDCTTACLGDQICVGTTCAPAFPRSYQLELYASLGSRDPDGACWDDLFCGAPDPYVTVRVDGVNVYRTREASESFSARYPGERVTVSLRSGSEVFLEAWDSDVDLDDFAARCAVTVSASTLRRGELRCTTFGVDESSVGATVTPLP